MYICTTIAHSPLYLVSVYCYFSQNDIFWNVLFPCRFSLTIFKFVISQKYLYFFVHLYHNNHFSFFYFFFQYWHTFVWRFISFQPLCTCEYWCHRYHCRANGTKTCNIFRNDVNGGIDSDKYVRRYGSAETGTLSLLHHKNQEMHRYYSRYWYFIVSVP